MHLERYGNDEVGGIEQGTTYVFPKLDGTNAQVWLNEDGKKYYTKEAGDGTLFSLTDEPYWSLVERAKEITTEQVAETKPDGGPADYYDLPFRDWVTVNDMVEYLSDKQWGKQSWIFKDILKACTRFGKKSGTDEAYDTKKIIYYGCRLLMSVTDKVTTKKYLQQLLDDKQFKENEQ